MAERGFTSLRYRLFHARLSEMPATSFNHVSIRARDLDQSAAFYELHLDDFEAVHWRASVRFGGDGS
jgi:hypothetical protein